MTWSSCSYSPTSTILNDFLRNCTVWAQTLPNSNATQLLIQALDISWLDYCNALLAGLPTCAIRPLQIIQNTAECLVFNVPKRAHVILLLISLHWLPVETRIKFKSLVLAYITATCSTPSHLNSLRIVYIPISLRSVNERWLMVPLQRSTTSLSRTFST